MIIKLSEELIQEQATRPARSLPGNGKGVISSRAAGC